MSSSLVRTVRFSAGHHYHKPEWSAEQNERVFGSARHRHGHDYVLQVTVQGPVDETTGFLVDLVALDQVLNDVVQPLDQRELTEVIPEFAPGGRLPTTEELARWFWERIEPSVPGTARLSRIRLEENRSLAAEYCGA